MDNINPNDSKDVNNVINDDESKEKVEQNEEQNEEQKVEQKVGEKSEQNEEYNEKQKVEQKIENKFDDPFDKKNNTQKLNNQQYRSNYQQNSQQNFRQNIPPQYQQQVQKKKSNVWLWVGLGCGGSVFVCILFIWLMILAISSGSKGNNSTKAVFTSQNYNFVMGDKTSKNRILEIPVVGAIMDDQSDNLKKNLSLRIKENLKAAEDDPSIKAIVFTIDSPGGGITPTDIIWNDIKKFKAKRGIPVITYCENITASGGYYIASSTDYIMATETSLVGSIGVISQFMEMEKLFDKLGIKWNVITSNKSNGNKSFKDMGSFTRKMTPEEREFFQSLVQEMWDKFVDVVAEGRKGKLTREQVAELADGRIYTGKKALQLKLIDGVGYKEDAFNKAKEMADLPNAQLVVYKYRTDYFKDFFDSKNESPMPTVKTLLEGQTPQFMYMWTAGSTSTEN